jgi:hypothetical protein
MLVVMLWPSLDVAVNERNIRTARVEHGRTGRWGRSFTLSPAQASSPYSSRCAKGCLNSRPEGPSGSCVLG